MRRLTVTALTALMALVLAACGGDEPSATPTEQATSQPATPAPTGDGPTPGQLVDGPLPEVREPFGRKPTVEVVDQEPADQLAVKVVQRGDGPIVEAGQLLVANYHGQTWDDGKVFDSSFDRNHPEGFGIGVGEVIQGWDQALVGVPIGSRVVMAVPPSLGYGEQGRAPDIAGDDTLVFVVDLVAAYSGTESAKGTPVTGLPATFPQVSGGDNGQPPTVSMPAGAEPPAKPVARRVVSGTGPALDLRYRIVVQAHQVPWEGGPASASTWGATPAALDPRQIPGLLEELQDARAGSRVVVLVPAGLAGPQAGVLVLDVLGSF